MKKYASCSKTRADIRTLNLSDEGAFSRVWGMKRKKVLRGILVKSSHAFSSCDDAGSVCLGQDFHKKCSKKFKISSFCPLIIVTKGDNMINNMVLSREIEWIGYEHKRNMLQVEFIVGSIYQYENVPETVYQEFLTAPSYGRFFESNIKNKYQARKIR